MPIDDRFDIDSLRIRMDNEKKYLFTIICRKC